MAETALHVAAGAGHIDLVNYLHMKVTVTDSVSMECFRELTKEISLQGANLNAVDRRGDSALVWATRSG